ncbi:MAG: ABC transporter permease [Coriobacteriales bacterium]|nr:ABC transporter permease [Coriobacteriales bacterium]
MDLLRDRFGLFFLIFFPTILCFLLGTLLASMDNPDAVIEPMTVEYVVEGDSAETQTVVDALIEQFEDVEGLDLVQASSLDAARAHLDAGEITAAIAIEEPFAIRIYEGTDSVQSRAVGAIFTGVARITGSYQALVGHYEQLYAEQYAEQAAAAQAAAAQMPQDEVSGGEASGGETVQDATAGANTPAASADQAAAADSADAAIDVDFSATSLVANKEFGISRTMMDYYAIAMIVMIIFMGGFSGGAMTLYDARRQGTLRRTLASPQSRSSIYVQYVLSWVPANMAQVLVVMLVASLCFGAQYAMSWQDNLLLFVMLFVAGQATTSIAVIIGMFIKRANPSLVLMPLLWVLLFLSGTFNKDVFIAGFSQYLPPYALQSAAFDLTLFGRQEAALVAVAVSAAVFALALAVGTVLFNRKKVA